VAYSKDDVVTYGGQTYITLLPHASGSAFAVDLAANKWSRFTGGFRWMGNWANATNYKVNDIVNNGGATYIVNTDHTATTFSSDLAKWDSFANAGTDISMVLQTQGDILYRGAASPVALNAGLQGQVLVTNGQGYNPTWQTLSAVTDVNTVMPTQGDLLIRGSSSVERLGFGSDGQVLVTHGSAQNPSWDTIDVSSINWSILTATATATSGSPYIVNTTAAPFTLTLPSTPSDNDYIRIVDGVGMFFTKNLTIDRAGNNIAGLAQNLVCDVDYSSFTLTFKTSLGWVIT
jgi:hypothetical protein